jgi:aspartyl-tRNA synthetase
MSNQERMLQYAFQRVKDAHGDEIKEVFGLEIEVPQVPFPRVTMAEAHQILKDVGYQLPPEKKNDLDPGAERALGDYIKQKTGSDFVYITEWPFAVRPFYHMKKGDNLTRSFDLLANGLEITTGAQREHRYDVLLEQAKEKGLTPDPIQFYLDFFRYGCPPHGGYGMGLSRLLMVMMKLTNIRETVYLFRGPNRLHP